ncbi:MAG TPA: sulfatase-like hydrolase/transferase [Haliangiales bacterium]|nr:sulfatase-like hydrolase/transferase [Haliangiales bacterium]
MAFDDRPGAIARSLWTGALAGAVVGAGDALVSYGRLSQFLPGVGGKLGCILFCAALYAFGLSLVAAAGAMAVTALLRLSALGPLVAHGLEQHRLARLRDPRRALAGTALAIAAVPCVAAALALAAQSGTFLLQTRKNHELVIVATVLVAAGLLVAGVVAAFVLGRLVEVGLRRLPDRAVRALSHPVAPLVAAVAALCILGAAAYARALSLPRARAILDQLSLRPEIVGAAAVLAFLALWRFGGSLLARVPARRRAYVHPAVVAGPLVLALVLGSSDAVRKAATAHTGLTPPLADAVRAIFDLDRDGYSSVLGGGDCNDLDPTIHPGAYDIPDDGIDQNCVGGDVKLKRAPTDAQFVPVPPAVPADVNVLLVTIDALRADHIGAYGYGRATSPALDALAARSLLFENAWAHAPSTRYSVPAIITGRYPSQVLYDTSVWWPALREENHTLAEIMHERGLHTGAVLSYSYFDPVRRINQGFDEYDNSAARLHVGSDPASTRGSSSPEVTAAALRFLEANKDRRFFLWIHYYDPHFEYEPHPGHMSFGTDRVARYDGEIRYTDDHFAQVQAKLVDLGLAGRTAIVVTGDHGEGFGEHGIDLHGYHLYAAQTRVPLIVHVPGAAPRRVAMPVGHVDIVPTLANLVGAPFEAAMAGRSLLGPAFGGPDGDRDVFQEVSYEGPHERRALATRRWHLLYNMVPDNTFELYDLAADPREERDVWGSTDEGDALRARLLAWIDVAQFPPEAAARLEEAVVAARPHPAASLEVTLGDAVKLLGVDLPPRARPGETMDVTWYFESLRALAGAWRPFVHVEGPGRFLGDHDPAEGAYPIARWRPGQFVVDKQKLRVPPGAAPGEYAVYFGIYQGAQRLPVPGAPDGRVRVGTLRVTP